MIDTQEMTLMLPGKNCFHRNTHSTPKSIPFVDLKEQNNVVASDWMESTRGLINTSNFIKGREVDCFERDFAAYCKARHCIGVASGTDALLLALKACGIGKGHEVITVSHSFIATSEAITMTGARPVFVDISSNHFTMDVHQIESVITKKTKAILPVHLYGQCVDMDALSEIARAYDLFVIEDACQAHGATYKGRCAGTLGHVGCFSFYPTKNLGAFGDAGAVITNNPDLADTVRKLADHGQSSRYRHDCLGINSRLDSLQAAVLRLKLKHLDSWNSERTSIAQLYDKLLAGSIQTPVTADSNTHVYHLYVISTDHRDALRNHLLNMGIDTMIHYPVPIHSQPAFKRYHDLKTHSLLVNTNEIVNRILSLPLYPGMVPYDVGYICESIRSFFNRI